LARCRKAGHGVHRTRSPTGPQVGGEEHDLLKTADEALAKAMQPAPPTLYAQLLAQTAVISARWPACAQLT